MLSYPRKVFLATAVATDAEMAQRIKQHQRERGADFLTVEEPIHLAEAIRANAPRADALLVDCLTFWLNNLFHHYGQDPPGATDRIAEEIGYFLRVLEEKLTSLVLVTNEINMGVVPADASSRRFVDQQGWLNQEVARRSDEVILMVSGIPQVLKWHESVSENHPRESYVKRN